MVVIRFSNNTLFNPNAETENVVEKWRDSSRETQVVSDYMTGENTDFKVLAIILAVAGGGIITESYIQARNPPNPAEPAEL